MDAGVWVGLPCGSPTQKRLDSFAFLACVLCAVVDLVGSHASGHRERCVVVEAARPTHARVRRRAPAYLSPPMFHARAQAVPHALCQHPQRDALDEELTPHRTGLAAYHRS
jgi:hypothetical protein